ncbi:molecular chaperone HtpG [Defluviitalea raffinosedens]|jgi:molecular chaperone HtpG|uniref:Molecular chaperone HtpG n=1 Tax=Defluviitalea raffinosedens TaxID=1450156 RepID=A0A7C8LC66_9FIRM|nr:molecular chaperone HtpG [Defluviitalea raffinosedens]KAE9633772.1 molecular chaperone HtpG [Defluviitalea raffinosedens]MBM7686117.1 molecular chaperone HtpG [Defluviitalea raffinosedens]MBZ4668043.1 molecular chaperone HtpG [Defluviitaleaceae bacterium]HHW68546.1 molecular chaperone HtpG [Candidatus Epulonipiscium sp.]
MSRETGSLSIHSENIFPIIKKWLYSDHDIFIRELISNGSDAILKLKKLVAMGEASVPENTHYKIEVILDEKNKIIKVWDNGIGMTGEEVKKYINQIAFSGAEDFLQKYKDKMDKDQIIGHFGLGFYSAFMVAEKVQIDTLSYQENATPVRWICTGGTEYEMEDSDRNERGTTITLYIGEEGKEFLNEYKLRQTIEKYCGFMPVEIYLESVKEEDKEAKDKEKEEPKPINDPHPLWMKHPNDCTEEEYKAFYRKVFMDFNDPLFWIHLNMDYPFNLKGILYFPKLRSEFETIEGKIKLYNNQVFVADNIKEVIPEFLLLLKGTLDCPDLPLNVSRSFLQNDGYVTKISNYITKKVADKLVSLFKNQKEDFIKYWDDIHPFIKYGAMREPKFYEKVKDIIIYKTTNGDYVTLKEYLERNESKHKNKVFYVTDERQQAQYIKLFKDNDMEAVILNSTIDNPFISHIEMHESGVSFNRIDADISEHLKAKDEKKDEAENKAIQEKLEKIFKDNLNNQDLKVQVENLKSENISAMILLSEHSRRMEEMTKMFGGMNIPNMFQKEQTLVLNKNNKLIQTIAEKADAQEHKELIQMLCEQVYDLAMLSHQPLESEAMNKFIDRSNLLLAKVAQF